MSATERAQTLDKPPPGTGRRRAQMAVQALTDYVVLSALVAAGVGFWVAVIWWIAG